LLLGIKINNYSIFLEDKIGALIEDFQSGLVKDTSALSSGVSIAFPLSGINALIGRNQTGKSLFLDILSFVSDSTVKGCAEASVIRGRKGFSNLPNAALEPIEFELCFEVKLKDSPYNLSAVLVRYLFSLTSDAHGRPSYSHEQVDVFSGEDYSLLKTVLDINNGKGVFRFRDQESEAEISDSRFSALRTYGSMPQCPVLNRLYHEISRWYFCKFSSPSNGNGTRTAVAPGGHKHLDSYGTNVQNVLDYIRIENPEHFERLTARIYSKIPSVGKLKDKLPDSFRQSPNKLFLYLLLLEDPRPRPMICIETPDMGLYHDMVDVLSAELRAYSIRHPECQVIFTTHNPYILESIAPEEVWIFKRDIAEQESAVEVTPAAADPLVVEMYEQGVGMGAIWYSGHFDD